MEYARSLSKTPDDSKTVDRWRVANQKVLTFHSNLPLIYPQNNPRFVNLALHYRRGSCDRSLVQARCQWRHRTESGACRASGRSNETGFAQDLLRTRRPFQLAHSTQQSSKSKKLKKLQTTMLIHIWNIYFVLGQYDGSACSCGKAGREDIASESVDEGGTVEKVCFSLPRCCGSAWKPCTRCLC